MKLQVANHLPPASKYRMSGQARGLSLDKIAVAITRAIDCSSLTSYAYQFLTQCSPYSLTVDWATLKSRPSAPEVRVGDKVMWRGTAEYVWQSFSVLLTEAEYNSMHIGTDASKKSTYTEWDSLEVVEE